MAAARCSVRADGFSAGEPLADAPFVSGAASALGAWAESTSTGDQFLAISAAFTQTGPRHPLGTG